ncbi:hypothetical protein FGB62_390g012 [Gracilaria domingensis]|nr:hypothetical protein FGB62_390g012 [Gracilaria domingensis]
MRPAPKVDMFLKMELILDVLGHILEAKNVKETARIIRSLQSSICTRATDLLATHLKQIGSTAGLKLLYWEVGRWREAAMVDIQVANLSSDPRKRMSDLETATRSIGKGRYRRACRFEMQAVQHAAAVAANAIELEKKAKLEPGSLQYANDGELLATAIQNISDSRKREDMIARLRRELMVPERRFFWIALKSMAKKGDFKGIAALSNAAGHSKGPPIGLSAFVDTCLKHGKEEQAVNYARRIVDLRDRARALARSGQGREAADIASRLGNQQLLEEVQDLTARHVNQLPMPSRRGEDEGRRTEAG